MASSEISSGFRHSTCRHLIRHDDPRQGPTRPICTICSGLIWDQATYSVERRLFSVISYDDLSDPYFWAVQSAFAFGEFKELELVLWDKALDCVLDNPTLLTLMDIENLVISTMRSILDGANFDYTDLDAQAFAGGQALILQTEAISLSMRRPPRMTAGSSSILLPDHSGEAAVEGHLAVDVDSMTLE
jgi:hypothetical protein